MKHLIWIFHRKKGYCYDPGVTIRSARRISEISDPNHHERLNKMKNLVAGKDRIQDLFAEYISGIAGDKLRIEFDENVFMVRPAEEKSVLDILSSQAENLGSEDMSANVDHYLYGLPKKK